MKNNINILIVDDEEAIVEVVEVYLMSAGYNIFKAYGGNEALEILYKETIDLVILDLMLPDISGEDICKTIKKEKNIPTIMLTAKITEDEILEGFSIGADDYVIKPFSVKQLVARVKAVLRRGKEDINNIISFNNGDLIVNKEKYEVKKDNKVVTLTPSEYKVLLILLENRKKVFTRSELLDKVIGNEANVFDRIIDSHIKNLRGKIENNTKEPDYILTVYGIGYKFGGKKDD